jgi:hypothetical protein
LIAGSPVQITAVGFEYLQPLSDEFDFRSLQNSYASFFELMNCNVGDLNCDLFHHLEERHSFRDRSMVLPQSGFGSGQSFIPLESEVCHRWRCEYFDERNGYLSNASSRNEPFESTP